MCSTADCPAALLSSDRRSFSGWRLRSMLQSCIPMAALLSDLIRRSTEHTLPTFARLQREARVLGGANNAKEPSLHTGGGKPLLPTALTGGKTREYLQLAVSRLQYLVEVDKASGADAGTAPCFQLAPFDHLIDCPS